MRFSFITLFPNLIKPYFEESILYRAIEKNLLKIDFANPRDFTNDKHQKVDECQIGGGAGMLIKPEPLSRAIESKMEDFSHVIFLSPVGKRFKSMDATRLAKKRHIIFVSGRYEGVDERIYEIYANEIFSIGDFILTGGELASLCLSDSIARNVEGVLGNSDSLKGESYENSLLEPPLFTKPNLFKNLSTISEYSKGNHSKIATLKLGLSVAKTKFHRPDLYKDTI